MFKDLRYAQSNCVCLCLKCHMSFHTKYGRGLNTEEQFVTFVDDYKNRPAEIALMKGDL